MIVQMIQELKRTTKRLTKVAIIKKYCNDDPGIPRVLSRCYNPFEKFYVVNIKPKISGNKDLSECYDQLHKTLDLISTRQVTGNIAKEIVLRFLNTLNFESQKVVLHILDKDLKCGIGPESINAAYPGLIEQFSIQLANKYKPDKDYKVNYFWGSRKFDGIRCLYQEKRPGKILTREGNELVGFEGILGDIETLIERMKDYEEFNQFDTKEFFIDGELFSDTIGFNDIQGIVLASKNMDLKKKKQIHLKVFALGPVKETKDMTKFFIDSNIFKGLPHLIPIEYFKIENNPDIIMEKTREFVAAGFEGLMLRHPAIPYDWKRSNNLLKSKLLNETEVELTIIDYAPGKEGTKFENTLGSFLCKGTITDPVFTDGKVKPGEFEVTCSVGSGFTDEERDEIWKDPDYYIGKEIVINYQSMSQNSSDGSYSLRFGIKKKGFKLDRTLEW